MAEVERGESPVVCTANELADDLEGVYTDARAAGNADAVVAIFAGNIASGKTTTIRLTAKLLRDRGYVVKTVAEQLPKKLFRKYLADPKKYGWRFQIAMAHLRAYDAYEALEKKADFIFFERYIGEDKVFLYANVAAGNIDFAAHPERAAEYEAVTKSPEAYIHARCARLVVMRAPFELLVERMCRRDRVGEKDAYEQEVYGEDSYFRIVFNLHNQWVREQMACWADRAVVFDNTAHSPLHVSACEVNVANMSNAANVSEESAQ